MKFRQVESVSGLVMTQTGPVDGPVGPGVLAPLIGQPGLVEQPVGPVVMGWRVALCPTSAGSGTPGSRWGFCTSRLFTCSLRLVETQGGAPAGVFL